MNSSNLINFEMIKKTDNSNNIFGMTLKNKNKYIIKFNNNFKLIQNEKIIYEYLEKKIKKNNYFTKNFNIIKLINSNILKDKNKSKIKIKNKSCSLKYLSNKYIFFSNYINIINLPIQYIITNYIPYATSLYLFIKNSKNKEIVLDILNEVILNIKTLHYKYNIFHGDLHLGNIIIDNNKKLYLHDFEYSHIYENKINNPDKIVNYFSNIKYDIYCKTENNDLLLYNLIDTLYFNNNNHYKIKNYLSNLCIKNINKNYFNCTLFDFLNSISNNITKEKEYIIKWEDHKNDEFYNIIYNIVEEYCTFYTKPSLILLFNINKFTTPSIFDNNEYSQYIIRDTDEYSIIKYEFLENILLNKYIFSKIFLYYFDLNCLGRFFPKYVYDKIVVEKEYFNFMKDFNNINFKEDIKIVIQIVIFLIYFLLSFYILKNIQILFNINIFYIIC